MNQQSRIQRYQNDIKRFFYNRSIYLNLIENDNFFDFMIKSTDHLTSVAFLTILNKASYKNYFKGYHGYPFASGIDVLMMCVNILENEKYYSSKFDKKHIVNFIEDEPSKIYKCLSENMKTLEENITATDVKLKLMKVFYYCINYIQEKMTTVLKRQPLTGTEYVKKLDIIKFKFKNENILKKKYSKLKKIKEEDLFDYIENKYCNIAKMTFVIGWLLGTGDEKYIPILEKIGTNFGYILKISNDFINLERDIEYAKDISYNMIANYGIHHCFNIFFEHKTKLIKGCMELNIYSHTMKEIIDFIEKCFDKCLNNTDIELASIYSSFTTTNTEDNRSER